MEKIFEIKYYIIKYIAFLKINGDMNKSDELTDIDKAIVELSD